MASLSKTKRGFAPFGWGMVILALLAAAVVLIRVYEFEKPQVALVNEATLLGTTAELRIKVSDEKSGIQEISVDLEQGTKKARVHSRQFIRQGYLRKAGEAKLMETLPLDTAGLGFEDGRAAVLISARDFSFWNWMRGNETTVSFPVVLDTKVPKLSLMDAPEAMKPGGAGLVVFRASEAIEKFWVEIDGFIHKGFPVPARGADVYGAMIGIPYDTQSVKDSKIVAHDRAGNPGSISFAITVRPARKEMDRIEVSDSFLNTKMPEFSQYYPDMQSMGEPLEQYLYVNNTVRQMNAAQIAEVCRTSSSERMWDGVFKRMRRSSKRAGFAEHRSYFYNGKEIDKQVHLGIDLASVRRADVEAANGGGVVFADYLGIYGQMVIIDHGIGVFSLYSHMSQIHVKVGDQVEKGAVLGNTGNTGMAGGDHLHFSMLVNGVFVNPLEWWDASWLELNVLRYLKG